MTLRSDVTAILTAVNDPASGLAAIKTAIASAPGGSTDLTGINAKLDSITIAVNAISGEVVEPGTTPTAA